MSRETSLLISPLAGLLACAQLKDDHVTLLQEVTLHLLIKVEHFLSTKCELVGTVFVKRMRAG